MSAPGKEALRDPFLWIIGPVVWLSRWLTMSHPYFADGPRMIAAARDHTYVIQPPGYWLYCHVAALFPDPAFGLQVMNSVAAGLGAMVFYLAAQHLTTRGTARLAALAYSAIFYDWFAGSVHSSYGGELFACALLVLCMVRYAARPERWLLVAVAAAYALVGGIRPSDGAFLAPVLLCFVMRYVARWSGRALLLGTAAVLCLGWYLPQHAAIVTTQEYRSNAAQIWPVAKKSAPIVLGLGDRRAIANILRVVLPLGAAFFALVPAIVRGQHTEGRWLFWLWIAPGLLFFTLFYISDATYLCFLTPAIVLLAVSARSGPVVRGGLVACVVFNLVFFLGSRPADSTRSLAVAVYSVNGPRYCAWALRHEWYRTLEGYHLADASGNATHQP